jgi:hypothetical protein
MPSISDANPPTRDDARSYVNDGLQILVGELFTNKLELRSKLALVATNRNFEFIVSRSTKDRFEAVCRDKNCKWRIKALKVNKNDEFFQVKRYDQRHTCERTKLVPDHKQASAHFIGRFITSKIMDCSSISRPREIMNDVHKHLGIEISYNKAWRAKESALSQMLGDPAESYALLSKYSHMLECANPGSVTKLITDSDNHFKYFFLMLHASKVGFLNGIRPVIAVDGTFLKGKFRGTLFLASCVSHPKVSQ